MLILIRTAISEDTEQLQSKHGLWAVDVPRTNLFEITDLVDNYTHTKTSVDI